MWQKANVFRAALLLPACPQSFSIVSSDVSVSRLLAELPGLTSLQLLDILAPALAPGQGLVVKARELARCAAAAGRD